MRKKIPVDLTAKMNLLLLQSIQDARTQRMQRNLSLKMVSKNSLVTHKRKKNKLRKAKSLS
jgi:hypothetical protein